MPNQPEPETTKTAVIITHGDVDGMTCAAQLIRREQGDCRLVFSSAKWITHHLARELEGSRLPRRLYVTDIPASDSAADTVKELAAAGVEVYWIDHHPWRNGLLDRMRELCAQVEHNAALSTPAGVLVGAWLKEEDPYCERIGRICYASERGTEWERNWFRLLSHFIGKCDRPVLERLAYEQDFTPDDLEHIRHQERLEEIAQEILADEPRTLTTSGGRQLAVYYTADTPGVYLGGKVFRHHSVDYCLVRVLPRKWQLASRPRAGLSLAGLLGRHDLAGLTVSVGGRPDRLVSVTTDAADMPPDAHDRVTAWVVEKL